MCFLLQCRFIVGNVCVLSCGQQLCALLCQQEPLSAQWGLSASCQCRVNRWREPQAAEAWGVLW